MALAQLFYLREAVRRQARSLRNRWGRNKRPSGASRTAPRITSSFQVEPLEPRVLLSATPVEVVTVGPAAAAAVVTTDKVDYAPGETAIIVGAGFNTGETVELQVLHNDGVPNTGEGHEPWQVTDGSVSDLDGLLDGNIQTTWYVNPDDSLNSSFDLTAIGLSSGLLATATFTDTAFVWDGGGTDANWTTADNWSTNVAPSATDDLVFPVSALRKTNVNNFVSGTQFGSILFQGSDYSINGSQILLSGAVTNTGTGNTVGIPISLGATSGGIASTSGTFTLSGAIDTNAKTLSLNAGSGTLLVSGVISG
ncbi:MAG: LEPR-XLL domain-containing protein, partial [Nitrospira sp.]|nr:LEPR-XLL domain-containing protein [Nitrospira sp.]